MIERRTLITGGLGLVALAACGGGEDAPSPGAFSSDVPTTPTTEPPIDPRIAGTVASGLNVPWGIAFTAGGAAFVSQRDTGVIVRIDGESEGAAVEPVGEVPGVALTPGSGEGGLLGLAVDPADDDVLFAYFTTAQDNRIVRFDLSGGTLGSPTPILTGIPKANTHGGGRLLFDADGHLLVASGDAQQAPQAQNPDSPLGKILRIDTEGRPAPGNPDGTAVWSLGHRNVQGLAFDADGRLWVSEFGQNTFDELNLIRPGGNYGWPEVEGTGGTGDQIDPAVTWATEDCSPAGLGITRSTAFVAALRGRCVWAVPLQGELAGEPQRLFAGELGRVRNATVTPGGDLWISTSNTDGRGDPSGEDDRILRVTL
ncbi:glucose/Sorbosone dehydrogenase [Aeromicrobium marinum DSM 15272]|uniref:Glucose/Sorbosone dehydrogenase n=1 Tax=Aeromicrobium marinum DSM 15272 TaxID=585531 RepID=E2SAG3_9ACTN|nr:PQQ-dependent sugar dehydrogenase [Aeromicrobium marinum]EFQ84237.1 glucose/Sorbosone dehydrogenase [Aeromicrobium marinum DSM 15272]